MLVKSTLVPDAETAVPEVRTPTPVGVPLIIGLVIVGLEDSTTLPEPVEEVTPVPPLPTGRVPVTPVVKGKPETFVIVPEDGVPSAGLVSAGLVDNTTLPEPVDEVTPVPPLDTGKVPVTLDARFTNVVDVVPVPPLAIGKVPVTPVVRGNPVTFVIVPEEGVPRAGLVSVGLVSVLLVSVSDPANVANVPVVGKVTVVVPVDVNVVLKAPEVVKLPPSVIVLPELATPVPPLAPSKTPVTSDVLMSIASKLVFVPSDFRYLPLAPD